MRAKGFDSHAWNGGKKVEIGDGGWETVAPSAVKFDEDYPLPREMTAADIEKVVEDLSRLRNALSMPVLK